ncbi:MAG: hypothetical protein A2X93_02170 [Deltaproteobacteria bacterium GWC2_56_8]|nr:MAG: hypothetical protein A2X99_00325 [Deltaproteobacteria bacterium GWB2_55_19]OGP34173.1 MAG: hypothetical protein A2X93_02170 [Deltaproteobacteria bacterium GWC2_56_8]HAO93255.1 DUF1844 domain-containing protein [Deltaproteobacteria bacterium]
MSENETRANGEKAREGSADLANELPPLDFSTFILSLSTSVVMNLGLVENPVTKQTEKEPAVAKQTIDLIALLKDKTKGNLTGEEAKLLDDVLHELRVWYCKAIV